MWRKIKKIIQDHDHFVLTTHVNPDGDGLGAGCALAELLIHMGKQVRFVCDGHLSQKFQFLDERGIYEEYRSDQDYRTTEVLIVLDAHKKERIGRVASLLNDPKVIPICIDHHVPSESFTPHLAIDPKACSVGAMIYTLYKESGYELNLAAATGIYASILCDTGRFSYSSTSCKAHKIAEECIKLGVDPDLMYSRIFRHVPVAQMRIFARALQHMELYYDNRVVVHQICREDYENIPEGCVDIESIDLEYMHELSKHIEGVECVILLHELPNGQVRISMRSNGDLDIGKVVKVLGGGGHQRVAGATLRGNLVEAKEKILDLLVEHFVDKTARPYV